MCKFLLCHVFHDEANKTVSAAAKQMQAYPGRLEKNDKSNNFLQSKFFLNLLYFYIDKFSMKSIIEICNYPKILGEDEK